MEWENVSNIMFRSMEWIFLCKKTFQKAYYESLSVLEDIFAWKWFTDNKMRHEWVFLIIEELLLYKMRNIKTSSTWSTSCIFHSYILSKTLKVQLKGIYVYVTCILFSFVLRRREKLPMWHIKNHTTKIN
mgnify:CR=1 FL=1